MKIHYNAAEAALEYKDLPEKTNLVTLTLPEVVVTGVPTSEGTLDITNLHIIRQGVVRAIKNSTIETEVTEIDLSGEPVTKTVSQDVTEVLEEKAIDLQVL